MSSGGRAFRVVDLPAVARGRLDRLPHILRILLENAVRHGDDRVEAILDWADSGRSEAEIAFRPGRVLMHDTTCVPALVDIAAMRAALAEAGHDPARLNPVVPVDVSTDHSLAVDHFAEPQAASLNMAEEYRRNGERYRLMKWATTAFDGIRVHPPGTGIMHTINLEHLASVVAVVQGTDGSIACPDTLIGTDSHTPMINGIGVLGWGVGGLEAESVLFGMPVMLGVPEVIGVRLTGRLRHGALATDLALLVTQRLRAFGVDSRFVEFFGPGVSSLSAGERAVVANMAPEYGAASGFFPIDEQTIAYLRRTGRSPDQVRLVEDYARRQGLWFAPDAWPRFTDVLDIDLDTLGISLAGPRRPQDRISPGDAPAALAALDGGRPKPITAPDGPPDNAIAIAAITSCTNTSEPRLVVAAALLARKARTLGLKPPPWVKTSFAPGSPSAERQLQRAGLMEDLEALGFGIVGHGCTTCIGNSGPLVPRMSQAINRDGVRPIAVLSGNRNFPGRVHPEIEAGFLASPPLVIAYALAGSIDRDLTTAPVAHAASGRPVMLHELWPSAEEIDEALATFEPRDVPAAYDASEASPGWAALEAPEGTLFPWDDASTYVRRPPFARVDAESRLGRYEAHPLLVLGDDITTDHISPAGAIRSGAAADHLVARGEYAGDLNVYAARRGNWEVMVRGLFTNRSVRNLLDPTLRPGETRHVPSGTAMSLWQAAERYRTDGTSVVVVAGERYGMGSSRDWAAKGVALLGARAVLALSIERIHRSNLIGMGVLPLGLPAEARDILADLRPGDTLVIDAAAEWIAVRGEVAVLIRSARGGERRVTARALVETALEVELLRCGGIIPMMLRRAAAT